MSFSPERIAHLAAKIVRALVQAREIEVLGGEREVVERVRCTLADQIEKQERMIGRIERIGPPETRKK